MVRRTNLLGVACCAGVVIAPHRLPEQRVLPVDGGGRQRRRRRVEAAALDVDVVGVGDLQPAVVVPLGGENHHNDYSGATALAMFFLNSAPLYM